MILFVDTALKINYIALFKGESLIRNVSFPQADQLMAAMELFKPPLEELDYLAVGVGPGSYTGVRQGVIAMQSIAFARNLRLKGISSLEIFDKTSKEVVVTDAKMGGYYVLKGENSEVVSKERLIEWKHTGYSFKSPDFEVLAKKAPEITFEPAIPDFTCLGEKLAQKPFTPIEIQYLRESV